MDKMNDLNVNNGGTYMSIATVFCYMISQFTVQNWASIVTILTGVCASAYYVNAILISRKKKKEN